MSYTVVKGDTLSKIAQKYGTTYQELARINGISDPNKISIGQIIKLPNKSSSSTSTSSSTTTTTTTTYKVISGDTLSKIAQKYGTTYQEIARINGISDPNKISIGQVLKIPTTNSTINTISKPSSNTTNTTNNQKIITKLNNTKILDALKNSQWKSKADSLSIAYQVVRDCGYNIECAIGLLGNLVAEGNYGLVEYSFSQLHRYDFKLPSGGCVCKTIKDIEYVKNWTTSNKGTNCETNKGSCGFGSVQWSYGRRVNFANICLSIMKKDSDVNKNNWTIAEATFITQELKNGYYSEVKNAAIKAGGSVEAWAEAFCDKYELPGQSDRNMSATGLDCITRRKNAREIYDYLKNQNALY